MDDPKEVLRKQIWEQFGDKLKDLGSDVEIIESDFPPTDIELSTGKKMIRFLGRCKRRFVWLVITIFGIISIYVTVMDLPGAIENHKRFFPSSYEFVERVFHKISDGSYFDIVDTAKIDSNQNHGYVVIKNEWIDNQDEYEKDKKDGSVYLYSGEYALPVSGSTMTYDTGSLLLCKQDKV